MALCACFWAPSIPQYMDLLMTLLSAERKAYLQLKLQVGAHGFKQKEADT